MRLHLESGGSGERTCLLLHGLGAHAEVWRPLIECIEAEGGWRWFSPDLRGHGRSKRGDGYSANQLAMDVLETIGSVSDRAVMLGHSLGGVVAMELACLPIGIPPRAVFGLGVKVEWTAAELEKMAQVAALPAKIVESRKCAIERHLLLCGLNGLVAWDDPAAAAGVIACEGGWCIAVDPAANGVGAPDMHHLTTAARCPVHLARGANDPLVSLEVLKAYDSAAVDIADSGHNAMVEVPEQVWRWVRSWTD